MTSITTSKSPKYLVRDLVPDARPRDTAMDVLRATAARVHKEILHLPIRPLLHGAVSPTPATARKAS